MAILVNDSKVENGKMSIQSLIGHRENIPEERGGLNTGTGLVMGAEVDVSEARTFSLGLVTLLVSIGEGGHKSTRYLS